MFQLLCISQQQNLWLFATSLNPCKNGCLSQSFIIFYILNSRFSTFGSSPKSQTPLPAEHKPRLRLKRRKRTENYERHRNKNPLQNIEKIMMPAEPFRPRRQKKNADDCRARNAEHRKLDYEFCNLRQAVRKERSVEVLSADEHRQPAQSENHQRSGRPRMESLD